LRNALQAHALWAARLIPAEILGLFDTGFVHSCVLIDEFVSHLALALLEPLGVAACCRAGTGLGEAIAAGGLSEQVAPVPLRWIFETLVRRGWMSVRADGSGERRYRLEASAPLAQTAGLRQAQQQTDPRNLPAFDIALLAAERYPSVLRGEVSGEDALFDAQTMPAWMDYFSNEHPLYAVNNRIGAVAAAAALRDQVQSPVGLSVLELGGGLGSGAEALLEYLQARGEAAALAEYRFSEIAPLFLRRARKRLSERFPDAGLRFEWIDIDQGWPASVLPQTISLVYAVNVLHVARDLGATLGRIREVLRPGGALVLAECIRPFAAQPVYVEFVFNLLAAFREPMPVAPWRPNGGFLTPEQWQAALEANGFGAVQIYPDIRSLREVFPLFLSGAVSARAV
jgi:SAM-dependent methyltransferase